MMIRNLARKRPNYASNYASKHASSCAPVSMWQDFDRVFKDLERGFSRPAEVVGQDRRASAWPRVLVKQDEEAYYVVAEVPGVDAKDLEVLVEAGVLVIKGERERYFEAAESAEGEETPRDSFERRIRLSGGVAEDEVQASHRNGVLRVTLPKPRRTVEVTVD
ncbi:MAG: Hsp20/alpha crystallin family protein [Deltaproteobacteria bacterium]|nr:Hsp20/alpha crystallin family protein [Deltaproteobacteria bacterium]MBW2421430.1 Hsp20/alpha crystallin family protein [Deltaproteobacteria bacterium]